MDEWPRWMMGNAAERAVTIEEEEDPVEPASAEARLGRVTGALSGCRKEARLASMGGGGEEER